MPRAALLSLDEAAAMLATSTRHVRDLIKDGALRPVNIGDEGRRASWRLPISEIEAFIARRTGAQPCQPSKGSTSISGQVNTPSTSGSAIIDFAALRAQRIAGKLNGSSKTSAGRPKRSRRKATLVRL